MKNELTQSIEAEIRKRMQERYPLEWSRFSSYLSFPSNYGIGAPLLIQHHQITKDAEHFQKLTEEVVNEVLAEKP